MSYRVLKQPIGLKITIYLFATIWVIIAAFPFLWTAWGSFKVELDFFSIADWTYAITGERTKIEHNSAFTSAGYKGAWIKESFYKNVFNTFAKFSIL